ncbi:MAG: protein containing Planctomycete extracellular domain protein [Planctomycetes bacterium]|nr:protein containing Planctomycete extracellular domain protein [Planctomycetota bacterium]
MTLERPHRRRSRKRPRRLALERLEGRALLSAVPFGAHPQDTAEFMMGTVTVGVVLLESNGQIDASTENWTPQLIADAKAKVVTGVEWWEQTLAERNSVHSLDFRFDFTYADNPVPTAYEPISRVSDDSRLWIGEFLGFVGYDSPLSLDDDIRLYNNALRGNHDTNWAFTIFVVNAQNDVDGQFRAGGSFSQAFAYPGGRYLVTPSRRPAMTITHETGHIFWARDEYDGGGSYSDRRGYYDTQNWNAADNPTPGFVQQDSIMAAGTRMFNAYENHTSAPSTLAQLGWQDSDADGVFDVLDVPHVLRGAGYYDPAIGKYRFRGTAEVGTLLNRNSSGLQSDLTINTITRAEYRIDGGAWQTAASYGTHTADLDLRITVPSGVRAIAIRTVTIDPITGQLVTASPLFVGATNGAALTDAQGLSGLVWNDPDGDGTRDAKDAGLTQQTVRLVDANGDLAALQTTVEPDNYNDSSLLNEAVPGVTLSVYGYNAIDESVRSRTTTQAPTGSRVFAYDSIGFGSPLSFSRESAELRATFGSPRTYVTIDARGETGGSYARLEAYDAAGNRIARTTSSLLSAGQSTTLVVARPTADIVSVRAFGYGGTTVQLDRLRLGPSPIATTQAGGAYWFSSLPAASYRVQVVAPAGSTVTTPENGFHMVTLASGGSAEDLDFGLRPAHRWQNPQQVHDINGDGLVTTTDLVLLVTDVSRNHSRVLPAPTDAYGPFPYLDITGDGSVSTQDIVRLLTFLSQSQGSGSGESQDGASGGRSGDAGGRSNLGPDRVSDAHAESDRPRGEIRIALHPAALPTHYSPKEGEPPLTPFAESHRAKRSVPSAAVLDSARSRSGPASAKVNDVDRVMAVWPDASRAGRDKSELLSGLSDDRPSNRLGRRTLGSGRWAIGPVRSTGRGNPGNS